MAMCRLAPWLASLAALLLAGASDRKGAALVEPLLLPLHTKGRYIVNVDNERVKWACINWAGAYSKTAVVGGLEVQNVEALAGRISALGFNCVRLCYSTQNHLQNPLVKDEELEANPDLKGKRFMEIFERTVHALTSHGLMVIINNHISSSGWCCNVKQDEGFWYTPLYSEEMWIESLVRMATHFRNNSLVVAYDIRNEPHDIPGRFMTWGDGNPATDWAAAAERGGNAVLAANPNVLIVVSALCFCMDLRPVKNHVLKFNVPNRLVYETHNYIEFQMATLASNNFISWAWLVHICTNACVILILVHLLCQYVWARLGRPWPRKSTMLASLSAWGCLVAAVTAGVFFYGYSFYMAYCSFAAINYFLAYATMGVVVSVALLLLTLWAGFIGLRISTREDCAIVPDVCPTSAECMSEDEDSLSEQDEDKLQKLTKSEDEGLMPTDFGDFSNEQAAADKGRVPGFAREPGWKSWYLATDYSFGRHRHSPKMAVPPAWDCGMLCMLQVWFFLTVLTLAIAGLGIFAHLADSYWYMRFTFDTKWGFALAEGYDYTAPVWMGEFGQDRRGTYWLNMLRYLADRDIDFAYWPLNGKKYTEGQFGSSGDFVYYDKPRWEDEAFGLLEQDSWTVRDTWKLLDIQALMDSPVKWTPEDYPCSRQRLGSACGY